MKKYKFMAAMLAAAVLAGISTPGIVKAEGNNDYLPENPAITERCGLTEINIDEGYEEEDLLREQTGNVRSNISAEEAAYWNKFSSSYYYNQLSGAKKAMWDGLNEACLEAATSDVSLNYVSAKYDNSAMTSSEAMELAHIFRYSHPQYYFLNNTVGTSSSGSNGTVKMYIYDAFSNSRAAATTAFRQRIDYFVSEVAKGARPEDKEKIAIDIIANNTIYESNDYDQSAYSMAVLGKSVCAGYSSVFQMIMNANGVETERLTSPSHGWNIIKLHDVWYSVDPTFADQNDEQTYGYFYGISYSYYNKSDATFMNNASHATKSEWSKYFVIPDRIYDSGSTTSKYESQYFTNNGYTYFIVNKNKSLGNYLAKIINASEYDIMKSSVQVTNGGVTYNSIGALGGNALDINKNGLYYENNVWVYYTKGVIDKSFTGLTEYNGWFYYVSNGVLDVNYAGLVEYNGWFYYVSNGSLDVNYAGLVAYNGWFYYVSNGALDVNYEGLAAYNGWFYYVSNGAFEVNYTGLATYNGWFYYVAEGVFEVNYTGLAAYNGWFYYVANGVFDANYTGLAVYNGVFYYASNGALNVDYEGYVIYNGYNFYVKNGVVVS